MEKHITHINTKALSRFIQLLDGSFPSGAFVHSFGLEPHIVLEKVNNAGQLKIFLENLIIDQYQGLDFVFVKKIYNYFLEDKLHLVVKEDRNFCAMNSYEYTKASLDLGANYLKQIDFDIKKTNVKKYFKGVKEGRYKGNELCILTAYAIELDMDMDTFLLLWCKKNIINIAMASLKISRIKPSEIQQVLFEFDEILEEKINNTGKNITNFNPLFEEVIYSHENLQPKLFTT
jgi:urease accessory protein